MSRNTVKVTAEVEGKERNLRNEPVDPLDGLWTAGDHAHANVGMTIGTQHDFGRIKVTAHVTYECDQTEVIVNKTAARAFSKALECMNDGMQLMLEGEPK